MMDKKLKITGFAILATILMLMTISPINIKAAKNKVQTSTPSINCLDLLEEYLRMLQWGINLYGLNIANWPDGFIAKLDAVMEESIALGCQWPYTAPTSNAQSTHLQIKSQPIAQPTSTNINLIQTSTVQSSTSIQSTCQLCASR